MTRTATVAIVVAATALSACSKQGGEGPAAVRTVAFYRQHAEDRRDALAKCAHGDNGYQTANPVDCGNAEAARAMEERAADAARRKR